MFTSLVQKLLLPPAINQDQTCIKYLTQNHSAIELPATGLDLFLMASWGSVDTSGFLNATDGTVGFSLHEDAFDTRCKMCNTH